MPAVAALMVIFTVGCVVYAFWRAANWTLDLIEYARATAVGAEDETARKGTVRSDSYAQR